MQPLPADLLERPPQESSRLLALRYLHDAGEAYRRLTQGSDPEALHDFRVAIRRLRSCCRAYRPYLRGSVSGKVRARLREITGATNEARDAEVLESSIRALAAGIGAARRSDVERLLSRLAERRAKLEAPDFPTLDSALRKRLTAFRPAALPDGQPRERSFGGVTGMLVLAHAAHLRACLAAVPDRDGAAEIHRARISAKRLRYLIEGVGAGSASGLVEALKDFQSLAGDLRDNHVLHEQLARASRGRQASSGLRQLAQAARQQGDEMFGRLNTAWLEGRAEPVLARVEAFGRDLARRHQEHAEIERKFLLTKLPDHVRGSPVAEVSQGWLPGAEVHERVRRWRSPAGDRFTRTIKLGTGISRTEIEEETSRELFEALWPLTQGCRVEKRRYQVPEGDVVWEVDEFSDRDLVLAEVELESETADVELPEWLRPYVVREVTGESEFVNLNLAK